MYTLADYQELQSVNEKSFFSRFAYKAATSEFKPDHVQVFCKCSMPYNPDLFMVECGECKEWFHPECIGTSREDLDKNLKTAIRSGFVTSAFGRTSARKLRKKSEWTREEERL